MLNKIKNQKGVSLFLALVIMTIFLAMGSGLSVILVSQKKVIRGIDYSVKALGAADTGVEEMLYLDKKCNEAGCCVYPGCGVSDPCKENESCSGVRSGYNLSGSLSNEADYEVTFSRNCGINTIKSTGSYEEAKRAFEINFGYSLDGKIYLNSASDKNCQALCETIDCASELIGLDLPLLGDGKYYHNPGGGDCASTSGGGTSTIMGASPPAGGQICGGNTTMWSYCKCQGL